MNKKFYYGLLIMTGLFFFSLNTDAATTGKIAGSVFDNETKEPLPYAQIMLTEVWAGNQKTPMQQVRGTTTDIEGSFYIINIMPGTYTVEVRMIGYANI